MHIAYISSDTGLLVYGNMTIGLAVVAQLHNTRVRNLHPEKCAYNDNYRMCSHNNRAELYAYKDDWLVEWLQLQNYVYMYVHMHGVTYFQGGGSLREVWCWTLRAWSGQYHHVESVVWYYPAGKHPARVV